MNKEQQELLNEAYNNYIYNPDYKAESVSDLMGSQAGQLVICPTQEDFINKIKTDDKFSKNWGLTIEERELNIREMETISHKYRHLSWEEQESLIEPTKLITIIYNDKIIESYE